MHTERVKMREFSGYVQTTTEYCGWIGPHTGCRISLNIHCETYCYFRPLNLVMFGIHLTPV